jgi:hypothetical protein
MMRTSDPPQWVRSFSSHDAVAARLSIRDRKRFKIGDVLAL